MLKVPPKEAPWLSWLYVALCVLGIFLTVPFARQLQGVFSDTFGREAFIYVVVAAVLLGAVLAVLVLRRARALKGSQLFWIGAVGTVYVGYAVTLRKNPEEALHFIEYAFLGWLMFRALSHHLRDGSIYLCAVILGAGIGIMDESIQWVVPDRVWDLRDIWINLVAIALIQVAIAKGFVPHGIGLMPRVPGLRVLCRCSLFTLALLGLNLLNTPPRILTYSQSVPGLAFLPESGRTMFEYGYLHEAPGIGQFRSRLDLSALAVEDRERGPQAAALLDDYKDPALYGAFLRLYSPFTDPFLHEARVHLFRRDRHLAKVGSPEAASDDAFRREAATVALRENQILERYFANTIQNSSYGLTPEELAMLEEDLLADTTYLSHVSHRLVTRVSEPQLLSMLLLAFILLVGLDVMLGRRQAGRQ
ncbi:MAG: VanZ family protein [Pseudomonadota bacterium]